MLPGVDGATVVSPGVEFVSCALLSMSCSNTELNRELKEPFHGTDSVTVELGEGRPDCHCDSRSVNIPRKLTYSLLSSFLDTPP